MATDPKNEHDADTTIVASDEDPLEQTFVIGAASPLLRPKPIDRPAEPVEPTMTLDAADIIDIEDAPLPAPDIGSPAFAATFIVDPTRAARALEAHGISSAEIERTLLGDVRPGPAAATRSMDLEATFRVGATSATPFVRGPAFDTTVVGAKTRRGSFDATLVGARARGNAFDETMTGVRTPATFEDTLTSAVSLPVRAPEKPPLWLVDAPPALAESAAPATPSPDAIPTDDALARVARLLATATEWLDAIDSLRR